MRDVRVRHDHGVIPSELTDASIGFGTPIARSGDTFFAASAAYGYAGDAPFSLGRAWYPQLDALVGRDLGRNRQLTLTVNYGGNGGLLPDVPLPAVEYDDAANPDFEFVVGYPELSARWHATDRLTIEAAVDLPTDVSGGIEYRPSDRFGLFARYEDRQDAFYVHDLPGNRRLFLEQQRAEAGLRWTPTPAAEFLAAAGYAFGQNFSTGWDVRSLHTVQDLPDQPFVRLGFTLRF